LGRQPGEQSRGGGRRAGARATFGLAWSVCLLCVALAAGSLLLASLNGCTLGEIFFEEGLITLAILTATFCVVGALIASHRPGNSIGWIFCAAALCQGLSNFGFEYATYGLLTRPGSLPLAAETSWLAQWIWAPGLGLILVFVPLLFPDGRAPSRRWRPVAWLGGLSVGLASVSSAIILWPERGPALVRPESPGEEGTSAVLFVVVERIAFPLMLVAGLAAVASLLWRFSRARGDERQQIKWFSYAAALTLSWTFVIDGLPDGTPTFEAVTDALGLVVAPSIPVATGLAIFRYRLYDIDRIINRTLVYAALTGVLVVVYVGGVVVLQALFRSLAGGESTLAIVASTLAIAALFNPLRWGIQAFIDRRFYRSRYDAAKTLGAFGATLRDETDLDSLSDALVVVVRETMQPAHASLWLRGSVGGAAGRRPA
jgi:hypothetical protein